MTLIEDSIIAYFDQRLSDAERSELLRQVSADPEHRKLFQQHEALRGRMQRAQSNVSVAPQIEDSLFSKITSLQPVRAPYVQAWRLPIGAFATVLVAVAATLYLASPNHVVKENLLDGQQKIGSVVERTVDANSVSPTISSNLASATKSIAEKAFVTVGSAVRKLEPQHASSTEANLVSSSEISKQQISVDEFASATLASIPSVLEPRRATDFASGTVGSNGTSGSDAGSLRTLTVDRGAVRPRFEFSMEGTDGSVYPTGMHHLWDFSGPRLSGGYFLDASNLVGVRFSALRVRTSADASLQVSGGVIRPDSAQMGTRFAGELYVEHRELLLNGRLLVTGALSGGLIKQGNLLSAELGIRIPFTDHLEGGISYSLTRTHSSEPLQYFDIAHNALETHSPNSVNSRLLYGLSYEF